MGRRAQPVKALQAKQQAEHRARALVAEDKAVPVLAAAAWVVQVLAAVA